MLREIFLGFIRVHILYHASQSPIFGLDMIRELDEHGYRVSPGTMYPILARLEKEGFLLSEKVNVDGKIRKYYTITESGKAVLNEARVKVRELASEILE